jgi:hypothetical protein
VGAGVHGENNSQRPTPNVGSSDRSNCVRCGDEDPGVEHARLQEPDRNRCLEVGTADTGRVRHQRHECPVGIRRLRR